MTTLLSRNRIESTPLRRFGFACLAVLLFLVSPGIASAETVAIKGGKIITLAGSPIENGVILIRDGKIVDVGANVSIPVEAHVIDATGQVIMPGFIDPHSSDGMSQANERNEIVPFLSVVDSIDPNLDYFEECRRNGITTAAVVPGNSTLIGGQAAIVKTAGQYVNDMILKRDAGMKISLRPSSGGRIAQLARLRKELDKARLPKDSKEGEEEKKGEVGAEKADATKGDENKEEGSDNAEANAGQDAANQLAGKQAMQALVEGKLPAFIYCETSMDVSSALRLVQEYNLHPILILGKDCYKAASLLSDRNQPVILDSNLVFWHTDPRTRTDEQISLPKIFRDAKVPFVFQTGDPATRGTIGNSYLWYQAALAVKHGTPETEALRSMSLTAAELLGIQEWVGSIEKGKDADLVILTGEPLRMSTWVDKTIVGGKLVYERAQDQKLKRLLEPVAE